MIICPRCKTCLDAPWYTLVELGERWGVTVKTLYSVLSLARARGLAPNPEQCTRIRSGRGGRTSLRLRADYAISLHSWWRRQHPGPRRLKASLGATPETSRG